MRKVKAKFKRTFIKASVFTALVTVLALMTYSLLIPKYIYYWFGIAAFIGFFIWLPFKFGRKPEKYIDARGYVVLTRENELEHRYIAKQMLGRNLKHNEIVHHINGRKTDNEITNLCLMDGKKHEHFHSWLNWKKSKIGKYPIFGEQKRVLVEEYGGTLLEKLTPEKEAAPLNPNSVVSEDRGKLSSDGSRKSDPDTSKKLYDELRKERMRLAVEKRLPPYLIFNNKTLHEMVETLPDTDELMIKVRGVGPRKLQMYGSHFIPIIKQFKT